LFNTSVNEKGCDPSLSAVATQKNLAKVHHKMEEIPKL